MPRKKNWQEGRDHLAAAPICSALSDFSLSTDPHSTPCDIPSSSSSPTPSFTYSDFPPLPTSRSSIFRPCESLSQSVPVVSCDNVSQSLSRTSGASFTLPLQSIRCAAIGAYCSHGETLSNQEKKIDTKLANFGTKLCNAANFEMKLDTNLANLETYTIVIPDEIKTIKSHSTNC